MTVSRRSFALVALALVPTIAACSTQQAQPAGPGSSAPTSKSSESTSSGSKESKAGKGGETPQPDAKEITVTETGGTITVTDAQGRTVELKGKPQKIVVLDWSVIRTLTALGVTVAGAPKANGALPDDIAGVVSKATPVGTLFEPNYEAIQAMKPDLVIAAGRSGNPKVVKELEKVSPAVVDLTVRQSDPAKVWDANVAAVSGLGAIVGKRADADKLMTDAKKKVDEVKAKSSSIKAMVVQVSEGKVSAYGPGSRFGTIWADFGYGKTDAPIDSTGGHGQEISQEFFAQYNPDVIFVLDRSKTIGQKDAKPALDVLKTGLVNSTNAAKNNKIIEIDGFAWYLAGNTPVSWNQMAADAAQGL